VRLLNTNISPVWCGDASEVWSDIYLLLCQQFVAEHDVKDFLKSVSISAKLEAKNRVHFIRDTVHM